MKRPRDAWILALVVGAGTFLVIERTLAATGSLDLVPTTLLLGAVTVPATYAGLVSSRQLRYTMPTWALGAGCVLAGALGLAGAALGTSLGRPATVAVAVAQDALLLLLTAGALWALPHRRVTDGLLLGVAAGAGFAVCGALGQTVAALGAAGGTVDDGVTAVLARALLDPAAQMAWTGLTAAALWRAAQDGWTGPAVRRLALVSTVALALHATAATSRALVPVLVISTLGFALLAWFTHAAAPEQRRGELPPRFPQPGPMPDLLPPDEPVPDPLTLGH